MKKKNDITAEMIDAIRIDKLIEDKESLFRDVVFVEKFCDPSIKNFKYS